MNKDSIEEVGFEASVRCLLNSGEFIQYGIRLNYF